MGSKGVEVEVPKMIRLTVTGVLAAITAWFASWEVAVQALFWLSVGDVFFGVINALIAGDLEFEKAMIGFARKLSMFVAVGIVWQITPLLIPFADGLPWSPTAMAAIWFAIYEAGSNAKNLDKLGIPVPMVVREAIKRARQWFEQFNPWPEADSGQ